MSNVIFEETEVAVIDWAFRKGIIGCDSEIPIRDRQLKQIEKFKEEAYEFMDEVAIGDSCDRVRDELGDVLVTLTIQANLWGLNLSECLEEAYDKINTRTGRMVDGIFVKDN